MSNSVYKVETVGHLAQWRFQFQLMRYNPTHTYTSDPFKIAMWNWHLSVKSTSPPSIGLYPEKSKTMTDNPPIASFKVRVLDSIGKNSKVLAHSEAKDKVLRSENDGFLWKLETPLRAAFVLEVEFLDLKTANPNGGETCSMQQRLNAAIVESIGRMIKEGIHTDITINVISSKRSIGACEKRKRSIGAHRAVLAARSPVFHSMFSHSLKENDTSTIEISDMSMEACEAFLNYLYGTIKDEEFMTHKLDLLYAAEKYLIHDLREACDEILQQDIDTKNVLERLQNAYTYRLPKLKISCVQYLTKFGKIFEIWDDFTTFVKIADADLICEIMHQFLP